MEATWIPHGMISLFSDALFKFSLRCFQLERHIHLRAPAEVIENEEKLIEESLAANFYLAMKIR
jgi:hypothetical protein